MYNITPNNGFYIFRKKDKALLTPKGNPVITYSKILADNLLFDLIAYGEDHLIPSSMVTFHYTMIDYVSSIDVCELQQVMAFGFKREYDWTFNRRPSDSQLQTKWIELFGTYTSNSQAGAQWLYSLNLTQLCAVYTLSRAIKSINIPFIVSTNIAPSEISTYAKEVYTYFPQVACEELSRYFNNFLFYFNLNSNVCEMPSEC
jgi:hypothetical protein